MPDDDRNFGGVLVLHVRNDDVNDLHFFIVIDRTINKNFCNS